MLAVPLDSCRLTVVATLPALKVTTKLLLLPSATSSPSTASTCANTVASTSDVESPVEACSMTCAVSAVPASSDSGSIASATRVIRVKLEPPSWPPSETRPAAAASRPCNGSWPFSSAANTCWASWFSGAMAASLASATALPKTSSVMVRSRASAILMVLPLAACSSMVPSAGTIRRSPTATISPALRMRCEPSTATAMTLPVIATTLPCATAM